MRMGLISPDPGHPLLAATAALLSPRHTVLVLDPAAGAAGARGTTPDVCLLKARTPAALELARELEGRGSVVLNSAGATERCQDRITMAESARAAGLPFAATRAFDTLAELASSAGGRPDRPLVVKSRRSRKHDLVARVDGSDGLRALAATWGREPVVVQDFAPNNGWDHKLWVVGEQVFAALRRSELAPGAEEPATNRDRLPPEWVESALRVGEVFGLKVYGVDVIETVDGTPLIVDVNAFPGIRGQAGAPRALADLVLRRAGSAR
ncbi:RimK family alpha-L-glutamate ligase [Streptomyces sp. NPDC090054]|uniref:ATP-grasp domain-containing protein n=1 Tax=Streptomyces sp. NPDC090054 TaxID=3365933 RepID=UPI003812B2D3